MPAMRVEVNQAKLISVTDRLRGTAKNAADALVPAINETLTQVAKSSKNKESISQQITARIQIKKRDIDQHIDVRRATKGKPSGAVTLKESERISLKRFGARQTKRGVSYKIERGGSRQRIGSAFGPNIGKLGEHVYKRVGKQRFPIAKLFGPSPWGVFVKAGLEESTEISAGELLENNVERRVNFLLLKARGAI